MDRAKSAPAPVLGLVGPTASGKTTAAVAMATRLGAEIVAVDAFTVYTGMDVGTAKPSQAQRAACRHHLVDVLDPSQECTVQWFQRAARAAIDGVLARGVTPLLVGGSGLYYRAVVDPLRFPPTDPHLRAQLTRRYTGRPGAAHAALLAVDPVTAALVHPANDRRAVRALEVHALTGRPFSDWRRDWDRYTSVYPGLRVAGVEITRPALTQRIDRRVADMFEEGLVTECAGLAARGPLSRTARQAIGYAEVFDHLAGAYTLEEAARRIRTRTRRFAVRQQRWFRADPRVQWSVSADPQTLLEVLSS